MTTEGEAAGKRVDAYLDTIKRMEPDIAMIDRDAALPSIAISLRRIADALQELPAQIQMAIQEGIWNVTRK